MRAAHYRGKIDGDIKKYLKEKHENGAVCASFIGYEPFKQLWDLGVICPGIASVRLYFPERSDEHYIVADKDTLEGVVLNVHSGQPGLHNTQELLSKTQANYWEVDGLDPKAYRG